MNWIWGNEHMGHNQIMVWKDQVTCSLTSAATVPSGPAPVSCPWSLTMGFISWPHWASLVPSIHCPSPIFHHLPTLLSFLYSQTLSPEQTCWSANSLLTPTSFSNVPFSSWPVNETQMSSKDTAVNVAASSWCSLQEVGWKSPFPPNTTCGQIIFSTLSLSNLQVTLSPSLRIYSCPFFLFSPTFSWKNHPTHLSSSTSLSYLSLSLWEGTYYQLPLLYPVDWITSTPCSHFQSGSYHLPRNCSSNSASHFSKWHLWLTLTVTPSKAILPSGCCQWYITASSLILHVQITSLVSLTSKHNTSPSTSPHLCCCQPHSKTPSFFMWPIAWQPELHL